MSHTTAAQLAFGMASEPTRIVSPYRINPLGAHVDHQGGPVLAKTIDQNTLLSFWPTEEANIEIVTAASHWKPNRIQFNAGDAGEEQTWIRFAQASAAAFKCHYGIRRGMKAYVEGSLLGAGLSSSASVVLAYLFALSQCNGIEPSKQDLIELSRRVENDHMGLKNGIQDQMSIVFGNKNALTLLDVVAVEATEIPDAPNINDIQWLLCYSGFSRELVNSGFNTRVGECQAAATLLDKSARTLGMVKTDYRHASNLAKLPDHLAKRARHFYSEINRVQDGADAWRTGNWHAFGELMNQSCLSSITQYESGSQPLIDLHEIASECRGVYGSRFCGGGYGGCLLILSDAHHSDDIKHAMLDEYLKKYPTKNNEAQILVTHADACVRVA